MIIDLKRFIDLREAVKNYFADFFPIRLMILKTLVVQIVSVHLFEVMN